MQTFAEYLARYRTKASVLASPVLTNEQVRVLVMEQDLAQHGQSVKYQFLGDDAAGDPVYRLGTVIVLQNLDAQLNVLVTARSISEVPGFDRAFSANPSLRK